ncbi:putative nedd8-like protein [Rosellinia necatrix]|uniref:Putative nedd8-like protein n=1 Tax=Rosellinia necatrix TaxID=77044 RepID=A0A1W2TXP7_ROSNE|nr:putative nedd8-like protein [Rosellinia necatrix]
MQPLRLSTPLRAATLALAATTTAVHGRSTHQQLATRDYPTGGIQWKSCPDNVNAIAALDVECGTLEVPLDYTAADSTETLELSLLKVPAVKKPADHSILFNFGGPGLETRLTLAALGDMLQAVTGGEHDLITWDPRGTAETLTFSCFANTTARGELARLSTLGNSSDVARGRLWAGGKLYADVCAEYPEARERGPLINTAFTARDAMRIVDEVEGDGLLRYWGFSYGTDLGSTLAALFPDRVEKVLIDGVFSPIQYFYELGDSEGYESADDTLSEFFRQCVSTPEVCTLAQSHPDDTPEQLEAATYHLIEELKYRPFIYDGNVIGYDELKSAIRFTLYTPISWLSLDKILDAFLTEPRNETLAGAAITTYLGSSLAGLAPADDAGLGIECVDKAPRTDDFDVFDATLDKAQAASRLLGDVLAALTATCAQWRLEARERFTGGFDTVKPRKPLLVIGNTYDSATSINSARNISETIKGSVLLEHGGVGHTTLQHPSLCTSRIIQNFFRNGTLPEPNTVCETVATPFNYAVSGPTWQDLFPELGFEPPSGNATKSAKSKRSLHSEDALQNIGRPRGAFW